MFGTIRGFKRSLSKWEDSYYGGYIRVLEDYPDITVSFDLDWDTPDQTELLRHLERKLIKLFILKLKYTKAVDEMVKHFTSKKMTKWGRSFIRHTIKKDAVKVALKIIVDADPELMNMFLKYEKIIQETSFFWDEELPEKKPDPSKAPSESSPSGENTGDNDDDNDDNDGSESKKMSRSEVEKTIKDLINASLSRKDIADKSYKSGRTMLTTGTLKENTSFQKVRYYGEVVYSPEEIAQAAHLIDLLDISFDPQEDTVRSLRSGKIDSAKIAEVPAGNFNIYQRVEQDQITKPFTVCILADESSSMSCDARYVHQHRAIKVMYKAFSEILPPEKLYVYGHSGTQNPVIYIYQDKYNPDFETTADHMLSERHMSQNYDGPVIECLYEKIRSQTDDNIIFISLSDGQPCGMNYGGPDAEQDMRRIIELCKRDGFVTVGIGLQYEVDNIYNYHTNVKDMSQLVEKASMVINKAVKAEFQ